ncbi:hypothetical protein BS47DRAFT_1374453 [Hydnum rufescens UP504]|uniref:Uncharacterized protein n=1 Tax=Hydnum rufescens UP504 TaxID=1448309 RepID=A0A9P6AD67_9AGAM|nr:hypothetical protein BS47DRAFT_1374453 [Hydnum rufescens UP504]
MTRVCMKPCEERQVLEGIDEEEAIQRRKGFRYSTLVFDSLDIDLVVKVLNNTAFSPFFTFFIPVLYWSQNQSWSAPTVFWSTAWFLLVCIFSLLKLTSNLWRNGGNIFSPYERRLSWEDQIVLITGGSSGVGELLANTLAVRHVTVVVLDLNPIVTENYNVNFFQCDVSKWEEVEAVSKRIVEEIGHPTIIVNNAGVVQGKTIVDLTAKDVQQTMGTNVLAHFWTLKAFLPEMIKQKTGHIVTTSSVLGFAGAARVADYAASKFALRGLHESLRYELDSVHKTPEIRTTLLAPGYILSPMFSRSGFASRPPSPLPHWLHRFLAPATGNSRCVSGYLYPFFANATVVIQLLPTWGRDFFQWISGANRSLETFTKVSGRRATDG